MRDRGRRAGASALMVLLVLLLTSTTLGAQTTAEISGRVTDQSGAVLPGVEVTATQTDTGVTRNAVTNELGSYLLTNLPIGPYRLGGSLAGIPHVRANRHRSAGRRQSVTVNAVTRGRTGCRDGRGSGRCGTGGNANHRRRPSHRQPARAGTAAERTPGDRTDPPLRRGKFGWR